LIRTELLQEAVDFAGAQRAALYQSRFEGIEAMCDYCEVGRGSGE
jgi:hypothetical protein